MEHTFQKDTLAKEKFKQVQDIVNNSQFRIKRDHSLFDFYPDYQEEIWVKNSSTMT